MFSNFTSALALTACLAVAGPKYTTPQEWYLGECDAPLPKLLTPTGGDGHLLYQCPPGSASDTFVFA